MAAPRPEHAHATDRPATATLPPRPAHTTTGWRQDRRPVVSKRPLHSLAAAKMSPHIHIGPEPVLAAHARSPPAAGSRCPAGADSAPHSEPNFFSRQVWKTHGVHLPPHEDIRLYVKLTLVELVACHCPVRVQFLITIHVIMEVALHAVKTHTRQQTRFAPVSPKALSLDTQEWPSCPLSPSSHPQNVLHQI
jgi:hypothetical protein